MSRDQGTYRALPLVEENLLAFIVNSEGGAVAEFSRALDDIGFAVERVDQGLQGLSQANPNLAAAVKGSGEGLYSVLADELSSESSKTLLRAVSYFNVLTILRLLDLQLRKGDG